MRCSPAAYSTQMQCAPWGASLSPHAGIACFYLGGSGLYWTKLWTYGPGKASCLYFAISFNLLI